MQIDPMPGSKELRRFGWVMAAFIALGFGIAVPWLRGAAWPAWPWLVAVVLAGAGWALPAALKPLYRAWMRLGQVLNWIVSRTTLALVYYVLVVPTGIAMRLFRTDPLRRRFEQEADTYRVTTRAPERQHLERPF